MERLTYTKQGKEKYTCRIWYNPDKKLILFIDCECWNFNHRRIKKTGKVFMTRYSANPCKHLIPQVEALIKQGYKFKENNYSDGDDICSTKLKEQLKKLYKGKCATEGCNKTENLTVHRLIPKYVGGKYSLTNCILLCAECHRKRHEGEFT